MFDDKNVILNLAIESQLQNFFVATVVNEITS